MRRKGESGRALARITPVLCAALLAPAAASAQSLLSAGGLGVPIDPLDARARALGGVAIGLFGAAVLPTDPAAAADLALPSMSFTMAGAWIDVLEAGVAGEDARGARFPALGVSYPVRRWGTATLTYGSVLDQRWQSRREHRVELGETTADVTDLFVSDGGIAAVRVGFARRVAPSLALGASIGRHTGDLTRRLSRSFDSGETEVDIFPSETVGFWNYSGANATLGAAVDVARVVRVAANVSWSGAVEATPTDDTPGPGARFDFPTEVRLGGSGALTPGLVASFGMSYADWSAAGESLQDEAGTTALTLGGGLEWTQATLLGRRTPFRLGYRRSTLPFTFGGEEAVESAFTGGVGIDFIESGGVTLAGMGLALERGSRDAGPFSESFLRMSLTLRVSGF